MRLCLLCIRRGNDHKGDNFVVFGHINALKCKSYKNFIPVAKYFSVTFKRFRVVSNLFD